MKEIEFLDFLDSDINIVSKSKAVRSRISKARMIERHFNKPLDQLVYQDAIMYETLVKIKSEMKDTNGNISNALRKYYQFYNHNSFPSLKEYEAQEKKV